MKISIDNFSVVGYPTRVSNMNPFLTYENVIGFVENIVYYSAENLCAIAVAVDCSKTISNCNENFIYHLANDTKICEFAERCKIQGYEIQLTLKNEIVYNQYKPIESISLAYTRAILRNRTP